MSIGRNDLCPCNSGKKYKQCCLLREQGKAAGVSPAAKPSLATLLQQAWAHFQAGQLQAAELHCQQALALAPNNPDALHILAMIALKVGKHQLALEIVDSALKLAPNPSAFMFFTRGTALQALKHVGAAVQSYQHALQLMPDMAVAHNNLGQLYRDMRCLDEAAASFRNVLKHQPNPASHCYLAMTLQEQGRLDEAVACYRQLLALYPNSLEACNNLGVVLHQQGRLEEAAESYRQAISIRPDQVDTLANLAAVLLQLGHLEDAVSTCRQALQLYPDSAVVLSNMATALLFLGRRDEAIDCCLRAIALNPDMFMAYSTLGNALRDQGRLDEALASFRRVLARNLDFADAHSNLLMAMQYQSPCNPAEIFAEHQRFAQQFETPLKPFWQAHRNERNPDKRLKIGYVSADLCNHVVAYFIEPVLAHHDKSRVEIYCYYNNASHDSVSERLKALADHWLPCASLSDEELAARIRADGIDILVDLSGHTGRNRLPVFARKPAPVQVTWLGYPGTTGLEAMDYRLTDASLDPVGAAEAYYSETLIRLPACTTFQPAAESPPVNELPALSGQSLTLACLNNLIKLNPSVIRLWARIMAQLPGSRLMLGNVIDDHVRRRLVALCADAGIPEDRLLLQPKLDMAGYLALHQQIDLALDPFPYGGGTTTNHALWMGVPVVTLAGQTSASRQGATILSGAGLSEFITHSDDEYVARVLELAQDLPQLNRIRQSLRDRLRQSPTAHPEELTRQLEQAYRDMWRTWCNT